MSFKRAGFKTDGYLFVREYIFVFFFLSRYNKWKL